MMTKLQTNVAQAFWCSLENRSAHFESAQFPADESENARRIAWFDLLLDGGIQLPTSDGNPVVMLITGPPGSGKTTLAVELAYRIARSGTTPANDGQKNYSLFFSTDSETDRVIEAAKAYGFDGADDFIVPFREHPPDTASLTVWGREHFEKWTSKQRLLDGLVDTMQVVLAKLLKLPRPLSALERAVVQPLPDGIGETLTVIAVDNLNNVPQDIQDDFLRRIVEAVPQAQLLICVAEHPPRESLRPWEYAADIWVQLGSTLVEDYHIRTIEIAKARYQNTVWGAHQLKIYPSRPDLATSGTSVGPMRRAHPYRTEGGIFIYPSIHYHLSRYKRRGPSTKLEPSKTEVDTLDPMLGGGLPKGRCTAFIGDRGGHKSHLGYLHLLHRIVEDREKGLVISLRDDEQLTRRALARILTQEFKDYARHSDSKLEKQLRDWERSDQLEILYFHPGYITPNEFFHRVLMSTYRMKSHGEGPITAMFNSIDQLAARFPLCAKEDIFVPGLIEALSGEGVTSVFIAVEESGQPLEQYGLLPMADLILGFHRQSFDFEEYYSHLDRQWALSKASGKYRTRIKDIRERNKDGKIDEIVVQVQRFAGGQRAGKSGILELVDTVDESLYKRPGLHFTTLG